MLCQFFDSEEYKSKVVQFLEIQGRILSKDTITGNFNDTFLSTIILSILFVS